MPTLQDYKTTPFLHDKITKIRYSLQACSPNSLTKNDNSDDKTARLWAVNSGQLLHILAGHKGGINSTAFSPNGQTLATASMDKTVRLWAVNNGQRLHTLTGHRDDVRDVVFSPDGQTLATASWDRTARL